MPEKTSLEIYIRDIPEKKSDSSDEILHHDIADVASVLDFLKVDDQT